MQVQQKKPVYEKMPVLALRGMMIFPHTVLHFDVGRVKSIAALEEAVQNHQNLFLTAQTDSEIEEPSGQDLQKIGTIAKVKQVLNLPGNDLRVSVEGVQRGVMMRFSDDGKCCHAMVRPVHPLESKVKEGSELEALMSMLKTILENYNENTQKISPETLQSIQSIQKPGQLSDVIAANVLTRLEDRQKILEQLKIGERMETLCSILLRETELARVERIIQERIKAQIDQNQKDYYLREQIRAIETELGETDVTEMEAYRKKLAETEVNDEARAKVSKELDRIGHMAPGTPEISISMNYVDWILDMPWGIITEDQLELKHARKVLDDGHYGLKKVKERIIEFLAVLSVKKDMKGPILCFVGPPGVGKTSIVKSIAEALGRQFVQVSLGGVRDEAEIRGHRRTYIGAIPGRIISGMKQAGTMNPVFLFDEIDKMSSDFKGDPASAMLEVLDGEQNHAFRDHYLDIPFDLSHVLFITTANNEDSIPPALHDRMEIIEVPSYTEQEKLCIARKHLLPKQIQAHGLKTGSVRIVDDVLKLIIEDYTRESGVRNLERTIGSVVRKATVEMLDRKTASITVTEKKLREYLGSAVFLRDQLEVQDMCGVVNGLAYTTVGGEMLKVECCTMKGNGTLQLTGQLGEVMQESAKAALSWVRSQAVQLGIQPDFFKENDIHIHAPEGAVPKDGPSAGVTMTTALVSAITGIPVDHTLAMTGETSLRGRVLPIGGLKEKMMAAYRAGIQRVLIPAENQKDLEDIAPEVLSKLKIQPVSDLSQVLRSALVRSPYTNQ